MPTRGTSLVLPRCTGVAEQSAAAKCPVPRQGHRPDAKESVLSKALLGDSLASQNMSWFNRKLTTLAPRGKQALVQTKIINHH